MDCHPDNGSRKLTRFACGRDVLEPTVADCLGGYPDRLVEQRSEKSTKSSEEAARCGRLRRSHFRAGRFRRSVCRRRQRSRQSQRCWRMRIERQCTHILYRRRWRAASVEYQWSLHLHVKFVRRDRSVQWRSGCRHSGRRRSIRVSRLRRWVCVYRWHSLGRRWRLRGQIVCDMKRWVPWWRTAAFERHCHIDAI